MNMKWTMSFLAFSGALAYGLIFLAQSDGDAAAEAQNISSASATTLPSVAQPVEPTQTEELVTVAQLSAADSAEESTSVEFEDPWQVGVKAYESGELDMALAALKASVEERPNSPYRHYLLGLTFRRAGESQAAVTEFERSRALSPASVKTLVALGRAHLDLDAPDAAREAIDRALEVDLDSADAWHVLGRIESNLGNYDEAEAAFRGAVLRDPSHGWAWNNLGYLYIQREEFEAASEALIHAVQSAHADAVFFNNLGVAFERTEELSRAALAYAKAELMGSEPSAENHERVAAILAAQGIEFATADSVETLEDAVLIAELTPERPTEELVDEPSEELAVIGQGENAIEELDESVRW
jgi:tetratricopeptide (TPR) repeat protein